MKFAKAILVAVVLLAFISQKAHAQNNGGDDIQGIWLTENKDGKVEIYRSGNTYLGKLIWGKYVMDVNGKPNYDVKNPDPNLRTRPLKELVFLTGLTYENGKWVDGKAYDSTSGKTYSCEVTIKGKSLYLRGYFGITLLGKTTVWQRLDE
jgi:uncharacterized protein (DUF2147 family)